MIVFPDSFLKSVNKQSEFSQEITSSFGDALNPQITGEKEAKLNEKENDFKSTPENTKTLVGQFSL